MEELNAIPARENQVKSVLQILITTVLCLIVGVLCLNFGIAGRFFFGMFLFFYLLINISHIDFKKWKESKWHLARMVLWSMTFAFCLLIPYLMHISNQEKGEKLLKAFEGYKQIHARYPTREEAVPIARSLGISLEWKARHFVYTPRENYPGITYWNPYEPFERCVYQHDSKTWFCFD